MPTNLYGPGDDFDLQRSHVIPALIRKFHEAMANAKESVEVWGTGRPFREFLHVDDLADACVFLMKSYHGSEIINIGTGTDLTIRDLAEMIKDIVGFKGDIVWDSAKPDGTPRKLLDINRITALGWQPGISLRDGLRHTYEWYSKHGNECKQA